MNDQQQNTATLFCSVLVTYVPVLSVVITVYNP